MDNSIYKYQHTYKRRFKAHSPSYTFYMILLVGTILLSSWF